MRYLLDWNADFPPDLRGGALAIGNFDGAHRGHASLMARVVVEAARVGGPAVALTFDPHPLSLLRPDLPLVLLTTPEDKAAALLGMGLDAVVVLRTAPELLALSAVEFFDALVLRRLAARAMVEGPNFHFGRERGGDVGTLARLCAAAGVALTVPEILTEDGAEISSSRVRAMLQAGDVSAARLLLGRNYLLRGTVVEGAKRGRTIGVPTANLGHTRTLVPRDGVYAVRATLDDGRTFAAAANVGGNPTFAEQARKIEVHLIGFAGDLYGAGLAVEFVQRLRDTRAFAGAEDLKAQLAKDIAEARTSAG